MKEPLIISSADDAVTKIHDRLRDAIMDRRLAPGAKLSEVEVSGLFEVGRTAARSALQMLAFEGLVRIERNRGAFVANPSPEEARQVFAARRLIEPSIVGSICETATPADISRLWDHLEIERSYINQRGTSARRAEIRASGDFHLKLASLGSNDVLHRFMEELIARSSLVIALYGRTGASSCGHDAHRLIVDSIERRDGAGAQQLLLSHIDHIEADLDLRIVGELQLAEALREGSI